MIARQVIASGIGTEAVARTLVEGLAAPDLRLVFLFADWRLDPSVLAGTQRALRAPVVGGTTLGVIGTGAPIGEGLTAVALGLYGDWLRVGIGVARDLRRGGLAAGRDAMLQAVQGLGRIPEALDPARHVGVTIIDGTADTEPFCFGSASAVPQLRVVGGGVGTQLHGGRRASLWAFGEVLTDAGLALVLESRMPCTAVTSAYLVPAELKTVVTGAADHVITELDGRPAAARFRELVEPLGAREEDLTFARTIGGATYARAILGFEGEAIRLAVPVATGDVLRVMLPGDLIGSTMRDLGAAAERVGGRLAAFLAFSCLSRHRLAAQRGLARELAGAYAAFHAVGLQSMGEQSGLVLENHALVGLAIGAGPW
ncbi:MAG TPA: FIST N-terminal domain-containing protein [Kofleriaceae bacterium]